MEVNQSIDPGRQAVSQNLQNERGKFPPRPWSRRRPKAGRDLVCEAYGIRPEGLAENWNSGGDKDPHVASMMLAHDAWRQIGPIALVKCCHTVMDTEDGTLWGFQDGEEFHRAEYEGWDKPGPLTLVTPARITRDGAPWTGRSATASRAGSTGSGGVPVPR